MADKVSFKVEIEGSGEIKTVTASATELGTALDSVRSKAKTMNVELMGMGAISQIMESACNAVSQLNSLMSSLSVAYAAQVEAETKLATAMRNTMGASDEEINRIKQLTAAQQAQGIVGDEVQLAAAQELATYLELSSSLETIIPTMNDMIAQQLGMGASAESATQIATMLGKVMNGQTKALSRYGYEFSEAQEYILKFGDESERAAILCDVVGESVGGMNESLAQTDVGKQQQLANTIGDIKENMGKLAQSAQPYVMSLAQIGQAVTGIISLKNAISALSKVEIIAAANAKMQAAAQRILSAAGYSAAAGTLALKVATAALYATLTMGLSLAIEGLIALFSKLGNKGKQAAESMDDSRDAAKAYTDSSKNVRLALATEIVKLEDMIKHKRDATKEVAHLNSEYGKIFGSHNTAAEWYDVLTAKSAIYAKQIGLEAKANVIASIAAEKGLDLAAKKRKLRQLEENTSGTNAPYVYSSTGKPNYGYGKSKRFQQDLALMKQLREAVSLLEADVKQLDTDYDSCINDLASTSKELGSAVERITPDKNTTGKTLAEDLEDYTKKVQGARDAVRAFSGEKDTEIAKINEMDAQLKAMRSGITSLINKYGAEADAIRELKAEYDALLASRKALYNEHYGLEKVLPNAQWDAAFDTSRSIFDSKAIVESDYKLDKHGKKVLKDKHYDLGSALPAVQSETSRAIQMYRDLNAQMPGADPETQKRLREQMKTLSELYSIPEAKAAELQGTVDIFDSIAGSIENLGGLLDDSTASWANWGANLLKVIGQALPQLSALFTANAAVAAGEAAASVAGIPIAGPVMAIAAMTSIAAAFANIPKFAEGALAYGTTLGVFGEYPGAAHNPEVVAPLDKLRNLIEPADAGFGVVEFRIKNRDLVGVYKKLNRLDSRNNG